MNQERYIWWLSGVACRELGEPIDPKDYDAAEWPTVLENSPVLLFRMDLSPLPDYIKEQYRSRFGRAGRGRLWAAPELRLERILWDDQHPVAQRIMEEGAGGIVIHAYHLGYVRHLPGFVTDTQLNIVVDS